MWWEDKLQVCISCQEKLLSNHVLLTLRLFIGGNEILVENALLISKVEEKVFAHWPGPC